MKLCGTVRGALCLINLRGLGQSAPSTTTASQTPIRETKPKVNGITQTRILHRRSRAAGSAPPKHGSAHARR